MELAGGGEKEEGGRIGTRTRNRATDTHFAMLRWTKISPGYEFVITDSGTRESAQPIQRTYPDRSAIVSRDISTARGAIWRRASRCGVAQRLVLCATRHQGPQPHATRWGERVLNVAHLGVLAFCRAREELVSCGDIHRFRPLLIPAEHVGEDHRVGVVVDRGHGCGRVVDRVEKSADRALSWIAARKRYISEQQDV